MNQPLSIDDVPFDKGTVNIRGVRFLAVMAYVLLNVHYILACLQRTAIPGAIFNDLQSDLGLLGSQVTGLGSVYVVMYASSQVFAGMLVDRFGGKKMGVLGGLFMTVGLVLFSLAQTPAVLYLSRAVTAIGQAFFYLCVVKICHKLFPPKQFGMLIAVSMALGFCGSILGTMPTTLLAKNIGWRHAFFGLGCICAVASVATAACLWSMHEKRSASSSVTWRSVCNLFNEKGRFCFVTFQFWTFPAFFVLQTIVGQKFIQDYIGLDRTTAGMFTMLMTFGSILFCIFGAPLMRLFNGRRKPLVYISAGLPSLAAVVMIAGIKLGFPTWIFLTCFATMSLSQCSAAATSALMSEITDTKTIAFSAAVRNFFPYVGCGLVGWLCGFVLDHFATPPTADGIIHYPPDAYIWNLGIMFVFSVIGFLMILPIPETRGKHIYNGCDLEPRT